MSRPRVQIGQLEIDAVTFTQALDTIAELVARRNGGAVFTPNVDHVVKAERHPDFRRAYSRADLCLADGMPLVWASRLLGSPLPEKVSGSDLVLPLVRLAAEAPVACVPPWGQAWRRRRGWGKARPASSVPELSAPTPRSSTSMEPLTVQSRRWSACDAASPDLVLVAFGAPKQELWIDRFADRIGPAVAMGVGGSLDFITGRVKRAPAWMSRAGLEWLFRLLQEPRRMWRRYLVEDPAFIAIVARSRRRARGKPSL